MIYSDIMGALKRFAPYVPYLAIAVILGIGFFNWANGLTGDVAKLQNDIDHLSVRVDALEREMVDGFDGIDADLETLRKELREEMRLTKEEVIAAIQEHEHDDQGRVVFRRPY